MSRLNDVTHILLLCRPKKLPTVPETLLKRRKKRDDIRQARTAARRAVAKVKTAGLTKTNILSEFCEIIFLECFSVLWALNRIQRSKYLCMSCTESIVYS